MPRYLQKRRRRWYAIMEIPKALRQKFGKPRFVQSLKTDSQKVAETRAYPLIAEWKKAIELARSGGGDTEGVLANLRAMNLKPSHEQDLIHDLITKEYDAKGEISETTSDLAEIILHGSTLLNHHLDAYMASADVTDLEQKSQDMKRSDINRFIRRFRFAEDADRLSVIQWIEDDLRGSEGLALPTCKRIISNCRGYWDYLMEQKSLSLPEPFDKVVPARKKNTKAFLDKRKPFQPSDYQKLYSAVPEQDQPLRDLIMLGAYTGARIEELCSLPLAGVRDEIFKIEDSKTDAGLRIIPIHSAIKDRVCELQVESKDGYLLSGLSRNKYKARSNAIGKRFGRLKTKLGYNKFYVFHSFRKGVATQFEQNGIPENEAARLLGHDVNTMTYGLYSGGNIPFEKLQKIIEVLEW